MPSEWGNLTSRRRVIEVGPSGRRTPKPTESVAHSPTPSVVRIAARGVGIERLLLQVPPSAADRASHAEGVKSLGIAAGLVGDE